MSKLRCFLTFWLCSLTFIAQAVDFETFTTNMRQHDLLGGQFVQEKTIQGFPKPLISKGQFTFWQKHGIEWSTVAPLASKTWITANAIKTQNQFGGQSISSQTHPMIGVIGSLMMSVFTADMSVLNEHFTSQLTSSSKGWQLDLTPRHDLALKLFKKLTIIGSDFPQTLTIDEKNGDRTLIRFQSVTPLKSVPQGLRDAQ